MDDGYIDDTYLDPLTDDIVLDVTDADLDEHWDHRAWERYVSEDGE